MDSEIRKRAEAWVLPPFDEQTRRAVRDLLDHHPDQLADAFFKDLSFGTGGMRGLMGVGTNRINLYTLRAATQGLANYLKTIKNPSVFIGYDVRHHSKEFGLDIARVLAANQIKVLLTADICPTPLVSFGCRHFGCSAAIVITASHNPPAYNGYKVYWSDGAQVVPPHDEGIIAEVKKIPINSPIAHSPADSPLIQHVGKNLDEAYLLELKKLQLCPTNPVKIRYTPLHGTGIRIVPQALQSWGYTQINFVEEQKAPDGNFTYAPSPNPEEKSALELGSKQLLLQQDDILIATDPDADRIGVVVRHKNQAVPLTGNQMACIILSHICQSMQLPKNAAFVKTIVTTELFRKIALDFGGHCFDVLTGFKYIAEKIHLWEQNHEYQYIFGAEESYGCLFGTMVRDKDAVAAACLTAEIAARAKKENLTLLDRLHQIYQKYGIHRESLTNLSFPDSQAGMAQMKALMDRLRKQPPKEICGVPITSIEDYLGNTPLPKSNVLKYQLADQSKLVIRPSGTEPKVKIYIEVVKEKVHHMEQDIAACDQRLQVISKFFNHS
jgi:phosphoglucomutase/phosphomannomutase